ncbi:hypothetical protein [Bremerella cremea]|uniref:hypothetical protein n=1 Tax=Bremerella cremea TaxID=1031537 RepID=UPI0031E66259
MAYFGVFIPNDQPRHEQALMAFAEGLRSLDVSCSIFPIEKGYSPCEVAVTFGLARTIPAAKCVNSSIVAQHKSASRTGQHIVVEEGIIHREHYFTVGWGGPDGRVNFCNWNCPADRWELLKVRVMPWRNTGKHVLLCGQIPWGSSVQHTDHAQWCRTTAMQLRYLTSRPIVFRPHPLHRDAIDMRSVDVQLSTAPSLQEDLYDAWAIVTFNSNAGVEATLAGIPAFVAEDSENGDAVLNRRLEEIETPSMPPRSQWLYNLAYTQWTPTEIADGKTLKHLHRGVLGSTGKLYQSANRVKETKPGQRWAG